MRRLRVRLGENVQSFGDASIPEDRIVELREEEAAAILRDRGLRSDFDVLGWVEDPEEEHPPA